VLERYFEEPESVRAEHPADGCLLSFRARRVPEAGTTSESRMYLLRPSATRGGTQKEPPRRRPPS
jgi:hypothetical protein